MPGLDARINTTDEIVRSVLPKVNPGDKPCADLAEWKEMHRTAVELLGVRRRIAHHQVHLSVYLDDNENTQLGPFEVFASYQERLRGRVQDDSGLDADALRIHHTKIEKLCSQLATFRKGPLATQLLICLQQESPQRSEKNPGT
jgi:hypothetical protein